MDIDNLKHYPRFVFNFSDGTRFATLDAALLSEFTDGGHKVDRFMVGDTVEFRGREYTVTSVDVRDIIRDTGEVLKGIYKDDAETYSNHDKTALMSLFIRLDAVDKRQ